MSELALEKSTTGREASEAEQPGQSAAPGDAAPSSIRSAGRKTAFRLARTALGLLDAVAPAAAVRLAAQLFVRPQRPGEPPIPEVPSLTNHRFTVRYDGPDLAVWDWGDGPTVLLTHGWNGSAAQMAHFVLPLVRAGYFVAALDLPGHGWSGGNTADVSQFADALVRLGRRVGPVRAIVGHSLGGTAAALAITRGLKVDRIAVLASPAEMPPYARQFGAALGLRQRSAEAMIARIHRRVGGPQAIDLLGAAPLQTARMLLLHDPNDREVRFEDSERIARVWPRARVQPVPGSGHVRMLRDADVIRRVVEFVREDATPLSRAG
jgi:pimeloyl-ACP methyl ester carboxylesterase